MSLYLSWVCTGMNAQEACVFIAVVVGGCIVHPVVPVGGIYCVWVTAAGCLEGVSTVHAQAAVAQRYLPIEHVEVEPGEHAFARPSSREGTPSSHHHIQHSKGDEVLLLWNLESQQSVTMAWPY